MLRVRSEEVVISEQQSLMILSVSDQASRQGMAALEVPDNPWSLTHEQLIVCRT